jgi:hypothetical protein
VPETLEYSSEGPRGGRTLTDPDDTLIRNGLPEAPSDDDPSIDPQTGRLKKAVAISERPHAALELKVLGASYADIARVLDYPAAADARRAVEHVLASMVDETKDYMSLRTLASLRLEGLLKSVIEPATDPDNPEQLAYHRAALSVVDRWVKLHGLDAPQRLALVNPSSEEFERVVGTMISLSPNQGAIEADIFALDGIPEAEWDDSDAVEVEAT